MLVTLELNVAAPAAEASRVTIVMVEPPSLPLKSISLSDTIERIVKSWLSFLNIPISPPSSLTRIIPLSASRCISFATSSTKLPLFARIFKFVPSLLILPSNPAPNKICPLSTILKS